MYLETTDKGVCAECGKVAEAVIGVTREPKLWLCEKCLGGLRDLIGTAEINVHVIERHMLAEHDVLARIESLIMMLNDLRKRIKSRQSLLNPLGELQGSLVTLEARIGGLAELRMAMAAGRLDQSAT